MEGWLGGNIQLWLWWLQCALHRQQRRWRQQAHGYPTLFRGCNGVSPQDSLRCGSTSAHMTQFECLLSVITS